MANMAPARIAFPKLRYLRSTTAISGRCITNSYVQVRSMSDDPGSKAADGATEAVKKGVTEVRRTTEDAKDKMAEKSKQVGDKATEIVQDAWGSVKEAAQKSKDTIGNKVDGAADAVKDATESAKRSTS